MYGTAPLPPDRVEIVVPGSETFLEVLRGVVGRVTRIAGFSYHGIEDFCLAVDEAAVLLLAAEPTSVRVALTTADRTVTAEVTAVDPQRSWPSGPLGDDTRWQVLSVLSEDAQVVDGVATIRLAQTVR